MDKEFSFYFHNPTLDFWVVPLFMVQAYQRKEGVSFKSAFLACLADRQLLLLASPN